MADYSENKKTKRKRGAPISESALVALLGARKTSALGGTDTGELSLRRQNNLDRYLGKPYGDERKGQSQIVTRQCLEAVEWSLPSLMRIFSSTDKAVEFRPVGPEDVAAAKQESEYVNNIFYMQCDGFVVLYTFIKSLLMNPTGYVKAYWEEAKEVTSETYQGLLPDALAKLMADPELEAVEQEESTMELLTPTGPGSVPCYSVKFKRTKTTGKPVIEPVPPEELTISATWNKVALDGCDYLCHTTYPTRSLLIQRGYDKDLVASLPSSDGQKAVNSETAARQQDSVGSEGSGDESTDKSTELIEVNEHYGFIDYDGDGVAEYRMVTIAGEHVLENEEIDAHPFLAGCAVPLPFTHVGLGWQELVEDLQKIYTTLTRQFLNNMYRVNNPRTVVGRGVNLADILNDLPGSPIRCKDVNQLRMEPTQSVAANIAPAFDMLDKAKESRTGVSRGSMGLDADTLSRVANGAFFATLDQANQRLEMLARVIAEFSVKPLFLKIHKLLLTNQTSAKPAMLSGQWVDVNPTEWKERKDMKILVGLGTGNKQAQAAALQQIMAAQEKLKAAGSPMVTDQNIYASLSKLVALAEGLPSPDTYFTDPAKVPPGAAQQGQRGAGGPEAALAAAQMELAKVEREKAQMENQIAMFELQRKAAEDKRKYETELNKLRAQLATAGKTAEQKDRELDIKEFTATTNAEIAAAGVLQNEAATQAAIQTSQSGVDDE